MTRRRWIYRPDPDTGELVALEVSPDYEPPVRTQVSMDRHYENTAATDGTDIGSRRRHREYMKQHNLTTADDYKETWAKASQQRQDFFEGRHRDSQLREAIGRAWHDLERKRKR
jgi:hypothetical protein